MWAPLLFGVGPCKAVSVRPTHREIYLALRSQDASNSNGRTTLHCVTTLWQADMGGPATVPKPKGARRLTTAYGPPLRTCGEYFERNGVNHGDPHYRLRR
jgi:hypothetical protein